MRRKIVLSILSLALLIMMSGCHYFAFHFHHHGSYHHYPGHYHHRYHHHHW